MKTSLLFASIRIVLFTIVQCTAIAIITIGVLSISSLKDFGSFTANWNVPDLRLIFVWSFMVPLIPSLFGAITCEFFARSLNKLSALKTFSTIGVFAVLGTIVILSTLFSRSGELKAYISSALNILGSPIYLGIAILALIVWIVLATSIFGHRRTTVG